MKLTVKDLKKSFGQKLLIITLVVILKLYILESMLGLNYILVITNSEIMSLYGYHYQQRKIINIYLNT